MLKRQLPCCRLLLATCLTHLAYLGCAFLLDWQNIGLSRKCSCQFLPFTSKKAQPRYAKCVRQVARKQATARYEVTNVNFSVAVIRKLRVHKFFRIRTFGCSPFVPFTITYTFSSLSHKDNRLYAAPTLCTARAMLLQRNGRITAI